MQFTREKFISSSKRAFTLEYLYNSAANDFVKMMKCFPEVKTVGDQTGGGAGLPFTSTLPNGWTVRFSACPSYDRNGNQIEFGIAPDYSVGQTDEDFAKGRDTLIEFARELLK